jgi:hypothetical protein
MVEQDQTAAMAIYFPTTRDGTRPEIYARLGASDSFLRKRQRSERKRAPRVWFPDQDVRRQSTRLNVLASRISVAMLSGLQVDSSVLKRVDRYAERDPRRLSFSRLPLSTHGHQSSVNHESRHLRLEEEQ